MIAAVFDARYEIPGRSCRERTRSPVFRLNSHKIVILRMTILRIELEMQKPVSSRNSIVCQTVSAFGHNPGLLSDASTGLRPVSASHEKRTSAAEAVPFVRMMLLADVISALATGFAYQDNLPDSN
jgi:hypothetical protein